MGNEERKRFCDMDKFAQSICENLELTEEEANKFIHLLWGQSIADVEEVRHGEWVVCCDEPHLTPTSAGASRFYFICSECKNEGSPKWKRCPICEAKMDKERES